MKKNISADGYEVYSIFKEEKECFLANPDNYKKDIDDLIDNIDDLKFDSLIILFGLDSGSYINRLEKELCSENKVIIFEPNKEIFNLYKNKKLSKKIAIVLFDEDAMKDILSILINENNFDNLYVHAFGEYKNIYNDEYSLLMKTIDSIYYNISGNIFLAYRCKESFMKNLICNLSAIENSTPLAFYNNYNINIPAIIISAGPSLDKNIKDMIKNKDKLKNFFIIAGNRTFSTLIENGIKPDVVVAIDPSDDIYEMMESNMDQDVPLVFYEYTNNKVVKNYKGEKIYTSNLLAQTMEEMKNYSGLLQGGSVAHSCISFATLIGCNPIVLVGQDLAYTNNKHHADSTTFQFDEKFGYAADILVDDIFGKKVMTNLTLNIFRECMEYQISEYNEKMNINFINSSYGANIKGAPHKELEEVLNSKLFFNEKKQLIPNKNIDIDKDKLIKEILEFIDKFIEKSEQGIEQCTILKNIKEEKSLVNTPEDDIDFQRFLFILNIVNEFENSLESCYLGGYFNRFLYSIKRESFSLLAKDYENLTSNMKYQSSAFLEYFIKMKEMLVDAKSIILGVL